MRSAFSVAVGCALLLAAIPALAQFDTGGLPQEVQRGMEQAMRDLENKSLGITVEAMAASVGEEELQGFLDGAVVRLVLNPEGNYTAYSLEGGELVSFKLGKQQVSTPAEGELQDRWVKTSGDFEVPKRPQKLSLTMSAGGREVTVDCYNKYGQAEEDVTYYVGPLNGLFCMGLADEQVG